MKWAAIAGLALGVMMLSGCAQQIEEVSVDTPQITLQEARQFQNQVLSDLGEYVSAEQISGGFAQPIDRMSAMKCDWAKEPALSRKNSGVFLPGGYDIEVLPGTDFGVIFDQILEDYANQGWSVIPEGMGLDRELELVSPDDYTIYLSIYDSDPAKLTLSMSSFSPCIAASDDFDMFEQY